MNYGNAIDGYSINITYYEAGINILIQKNLSSS